MDLFYDGLEANCEKKGSFHNDPHKPRDPSGIAPYRRGELLCHRNERCGRSRRSASVRGAGIHLRVLRLRVARRELSFGSRTARSL